MALLLNNKSYVKFEADGTFYIYKNKTARNSNKKATTSDEVISKYSEIYFSLASKAATWAESTKWKAEFDNYWEHLQALNSEGHYPLMQQYVEDVDKTIPEIISSGELPKLADEAGGSLEKIYELAKKYEIFGKQEDIKDC